MVDRSSSPLCGITACLKQGPDSRFHSVQDKYVDAVLAATAAVPVLIPAVGGRAALDGLLDRVDGILVTGSPSNVEPAHYGGPAARDGNVADPERDATTLPLLRRAVQDGVPVFAICRGIQELNVALGGSLHQHVHELPGRRDHRSDKTRPYDERYGIAHPVLLTAGGRLRRLLGGAERVVVNSLHSQGIDRLASALTVEALAEDGTIEAVSCPGSPGFVLGVQWHPEWGAAENPVSRPLFAAFGEAMAARAATRSGHARLSAVA